MGNVLLFSAVATDLIMVSAPLQKFDNDWQPAGAAARWLKLETRPRDRKQRSLEVGSTDRNDRTHLGLVSKKSVPTRPCRNVEVQGGHKRAFGTAGPGCCPENGILPAGRSLSGRTEASQLIFTGLF